MIASESNTPLVQYALAYAARGWYVFPTHEIIGDKCSCGDAQCISPGKHPRTVRGVHDSSIDANQIGAWWNHWPSAPIAIDCGRSGLTVADVDVKKGAQGAATMRWYLDRPDAHFNDTYLVATPSGGYHFYFAGATNSGRKQPLGPGIDVQSTGRYVLAPPSPGYQLLRNAVLVPFPLHLLQQKSADDSTIAFGETRAWEGPERPAIPYGEHRQALLWLGWHLRSVQGLSTEAAMPLMRGFVGALEQYDPSRPFTDRDLLGMLRNVKPNVATAAPPITGTLDAIVPANDIINVSTVPRQIVVPGLLIRGELHVFYGPDGVGKTSLVAYLLALVSRQSRDVLVFVSEDQPRDFALKFAMAGGDLARLHLYSAGRSMREFLLPKCKVDLEAMLQMRPWGAIYFDSIGDLKSTDLRVNAADEARQLYGPLSVFAQQYDTTILCTAHTNARDVLEGARQIRAKSRVLARVERPDFQVEQHEDGTISFGLLQYDPLWTAVVTTEKFSRGKPGAAYAFQFEERVSVNPYTGQIDHELQPDGMQTPRMQYVCTTHGPLPERVAKVPREQVKSDREAKVYDIVRACPNFTANEIYKQVGGDRNSVLALVKKARAEMGMQP